MFNLLHLPAVFKYTTDIAWIFLTILSIININYGRVAIAKKHIIMIIFPLLFLLFTFCCYIFNYQSVFYFLWGFRNNFRFYFFFISCILFFKKEDIDTFLNLIDKVLWFNFIVVLIQYFFLGKRNDFLGGIFGTEKGCNAYLFIFLIIITVKSVLYFLNEKESIISLILKCGSALLVSTLAELKFFIIVILVIVVLAVLITDFSWRKFSLVLCSLIGVVLSVNLIVIIYPYFARLLSIESLIESVTVGGYSSEEQVNRLTTIPIISKRFLETLPQKLFGLGLGNCDTAAYDFLNTPFYQDFSYIRYNWFSTSFLYLETGFIGLILFFAFFILVTFFSLRKVKAENKLYYHFSAIMSVCCILIAIYNVSLRMEIGFLAYFTLTFPFILENKSSKLI